MATLKIVPLCNENEEFFGEDFIKRCFEVAVIALVTHLHFRSLCVPTTHRITRTDSHKSYIVYHNSHSIERDPELGLMRCCSG